MTVTVANTQRESPVNTARMGRLARAAVKRLRIRAPGTLAVTFIGSRRMRALNKRFCRHDAVTDVLSFRYEDVPRLGFASLGIQPVIGEILVTPRVARVYAKQHGIAYEAELSRYVIHGLLHWAGHDDRTAEERRLMRTLEDRLLPIQNLKSKIQNSHHVRER